MKDKILIFFDQDIVVRAFYKSDTFKILEKNFQVEYVFPIDNSSEKKYLNINFDIFSNKKIHFVDIKRNRMGMWYHLFIAQLLFYHRGKSTYKATLETKVKMELTPKLVILMRLLSKPIIFHVFKYIFRKILGNSKELSNLLKDVKPLCVIYPSVLTGPFICELPREAKKLNIKSIVCMNSWDNPMSKAIPNDNPDYLIVWGEDSKNQSIDLLGIPEKSIQKFGAAQFQIYKQKSKFSKSMLHQKFNTPTDKRCVLYAGVGESEVETKILNLLENAIQRKLLKDTHIIYRPHPWRGKLLGNERNFFDMNYKHISMDPHMKNYYLDSIFNNNRKFFMIDYSITRDLLELVDGVVSPRSTVLLEAAILGKLPFVIFPEDDQNIKFSKENIHFENFCNLKNVITCFSWSDFDNKIQTFNRNLGKIDISKDLISDINYIVDMKGLSYGERLNSLVESIS